jgi:adenosylcobinamide-GDP ribazoletransferase
MRSFLVAVAFLTIIPIRFRDMPTPADVARSRFWYPVVGLFLGAVLGGWTFLLTQFATPMIGAFLVLVAWVGLTGALHLDGVADLCDGLFGGKTPEERLRIMKDPHVGTFGVVGLLLLLLGKFAALDDLLARRPGEAPYLIPVAALVSRSLVCVMARFGHYPRPDGTGKALVEATGMWTVVVNGTLATAVILALPVANWATVLPIAIAANIFMTLTSVCQWRLGGVTGDCLGAGIEITEMTLLLSAGILL